MRYRIRAIRCMVVLWVLASTTLTAHAQKRWTAHELGPEGPSYVAEMQVYRVLTEITGDGLTSQTLPGVTGSFHVIHEKWDDVKVVMDGETLTWNGHTRPEHPRIIHLASPRIESKNNIGISISIHDEKELQYFERKEGDLFVLRTMRTSEPAKIPLLGNIPVISHLFRADGKRNGHTSQQNWIASKPGVHIRISPEATKESGVWEAEFEFQAHWISSRKPIEGVQLNVGKPELDGVGVFGKLGLYEAKWVCYRTPTPARGYLYLFLKIQPKD